MAEQRFHCPGCGKSWTGMQLEHCTVCHETFNNTRAGDKHRVVVETYTILKNGKSIIHLPSDDDMLPFWESKGWKIVSEGNETRRCLTPAEMRAKGMNQEKNGCWNNGGNWSPDLYKKG